MKPKDLSKLSKAEKLALLDVVAEKETRERGKAANYVPNEGQAAVHGSTAQTRVVFSGNGAGKSALAANEVIWFCKGYNPILDEYTVVPARVIVLLDNPSKITDLWMPELSKWCNFTEDQFHKRGKPFVSQITFPNGSEILFFTHDQGLLTFESIELDYLVADEPPPRQVWVALQRGARKKGTKPRFLLVGTPIAASWLRTDVYEPWSRGELPDTECFRFETEVNRKHLAEGYIEQFSRVLNDKEKLIRLKGHFFDLDGLALAHLFDPKVHFIEPPEWDQRNPCVVIMDPHPSKAHHALLLGVNRDNEFFALDEYKEKAIARDFTISLIERGWFDKEQYNVIDIVYDSLGSGQTTSGEGFRSFGEVVTEVLRANNIGRARATTYAEKSDEDFVERIRDVLAIPDEANNFGLRLPRLRISKACPGLKHDIENVQWAQYAKNRGIDENKPSLDIRHRDFLSCLKYGLATNLFYKKTKTKIYSRAPGAYGVTRPNSTAYYRRRLLGR